MWKKVFDLIIVIRNGKIVWKHGPYCWYFRLNLKYLGWPYRAYIKTAKNGVCEELLSENDFEAVLATFCCYDHGAKASEAVQKIATDQKEYREWFSCVIICWIAKETSDVAKKAAEVAQSFIHNGSEITPCMGHSIKTKSTKSKATFLILSLAKLKGERRPF